MKRLIRGLAAAIALVALGACTTDPTPPGLVGGGVLESAAAERQAADNDSAGISPLTDDPALSIDQGDGGPTLASVAPGKARIEFAPIMGADASELGPLNQRLAQRGAEKGIAVSMREDPAATHIVKGYFSTLSEGGGNTLVYVWDVFDRAGVRVHRIQGKEAALGQGLGPALRDIADRTMDDLAGWLASRQG